MKIFHNCLNIVLKWLIMCANVVTKNRYNIMCKEIIFFNFISNRYSEKSDVFCSNNQALLYYFLLNTMQNGLR